MLLSFSLEHLSRVFHNTRLASSFSLVRRAHLQLCRRCSSASSTLTEQQIADADQLEPSFEYLLRDATVDNGTILALHHCEISDRETFVGLDDSAEGLKSLAKDMGIRIKESVSNSSSEEKRTSNVENRMLESRQLGCIS